MSHMHSRGLGGVAFSALLVASLTACSGDDTTNPVSTDGGADAHEAGSGSSSTGHSSASGSSGSRSSDGGGPSDGGGTDAGSSESSTDASTQDGTIAETGSGNSSSASGGSGGPDAGATAALHLCSLFDRDFMLNEGDASIAMAAYDRTGSWAGAINFDFGTVIGGDCRIQNMVNTALTNDQQSQYLNDLNGWLQQLVGCPVPGDAGALTYGLIPSPLSSHIFSTADLQLLNDSFFFAIEDTLATQGAPDLTADQAAAIKAQLAYLAGTVSGTVTSNAYTYYNASACPVEAGPDVSDGNSATDARTDADAGAPADAATEGG